MQLTTTAGASEQIPLIFAASKTVMSLGDLLLLTQKYGDAINTQQAGRSEQNEIRDMLGFNTEPFDSENPTAC